MAQVMRDFDRHNTVSILAALLTLPSLHANTLRIEVGLHLSVAYCAGTRTADRSEVSRWLNDDSLLGCVKHLEDPASDVFVTNVETTDGNRRIFEGAWSSNAYYAQSVVDPISAPGAPRECAALQQPVFALLRLSEEVAARLKLQRWHSEHSLPHAVVELPSSQRIFQRVKALEFTDDQLTSLGISRRCLAPFILRNSDRKTIVEEDVGHTTLERRPIVNFGKRVLLAIPAAVSPAIRRYVVTTLLRSGRCRSLAKAINRKQASEVERDCLTRIEAPREFVQPPSRASLVPSSYERLVRYDENKYVHTILLHDEGLADVDTEGLCSPAALPQSSLTALKQHIDRVAKRCRSTDGFSVGWSLLVIGGIGRARTLDLAHEASWWHVATISLPEFLLLCSESDRPIRRFLKFMVQKRSLIEGGNGFGPNTDYDIYSYWRQNGFRFLQRTMSVSSRSVIIVGEDIPAVARKEVRKSFDPHLVQLPDGRYCGVFRYTAESLFDYQKDLPIYLSKFHLDRGVLSAVVETSRGPSWFTAHSESADGPRREFVYQFFRSFVNLYESLVKEIEARVNSTAAGPLEVRLNLDGVTLVQEYADLPKIRRSGTIDVALDDEGRRATLTFPADTLLLFNQVANAGEQLVLRAMSQGLIGLHVGSATAAHDALTNLVTERILNDSGARLLHVFSDFDPIQQLVMNSGEAVFLSSEDYEFSKCELSDGFSPLKSPRKIVSRPECTKFLNGLVESVWTSLQLELGKYNRDLLVERVLTVHEVSIGDRYHWRRTARAVLSLHSAHADVFRAMKDRQSLRSNIQLPARTVVEMAVCQSPVSGGRAPSAWDVDSLLAKTRLLLQIATDSDAIFHGLAQPSIEVHANGEYTVSSDFYESILEPFISAEMGDDHKRASEEYDRYYRTTMSDGKADPFSKEFAIAFNAEFGVSPAETSECVAELIDWCYELGAVVMETSVGEVKRRIMVNRGVSQEGANAVVRSFGLFPRESWERPPDGFKARDIWPWRYSRRLSTIARPLVVWGAGNNDKVIYGIATLVESILHVMTRANEGRISQDFFVSPKMSAYLGEANNKLGRVFNGEVAQQMRREGWNVREEVAMTELGASDTFGDVDVLAWKLSGDVQIIECKRLQLARTVAEVAELCKRFRGEENDNLRKHMRRADWIRSNAAFLSSIVGFRADPERIADRIVTNVHVPMTYITSLPIDPGKIGPLRKSGLEGPPAE